MTPVNHIRFVKSIIAALAVMVFVLSPLALILTGTVFAAGVPSVVSYQGRLTDSSGNLLGGSGTTYYFKFSLWSGSTVGSNTRYWPSSPTAVPITVKQGVFNVNIGDVATGYPDVLDYSFDSSNAYLQVEVSSDGLSYETLSPRQLISASAFAKVAGSVSGTGQSSFGTITPDSNSVVTIQSTTTSSTALALRGASGQTSSLFKAYDFSNNHLFSINANGGVFASSSIQVTGASTLYGNLLVGGLSTFAQASSSAFSALNGLFAGTTSTTTIVGDGATSTFAGGILASGGARITGGGIRVDSFNCSIFANGGVITTDANGNLVCEDDDAGVGGGGITTLNGLISTTQTFATSSDANISLSIVSSGSVHTFSPAWTGILSAARGGTGLGSITDGQLLIGGAGNTVTQVSTSSLGLLTTNVAEGSNLYYTDDRVESYVDALNKGYFFATTSADYFESIQSRWGTTSSAYFLSVNQGSAFSTSSASYFITQNQGGSFSTTSAAYFLSQNIGGAFSTTSALYFLSQNQSGAFSTTSNDYWKSQNNFFSTTSVAYWDSTQSRWATTSADYWKAQNNFFSTTSTSYFVGQGLAFSTTSADYYKSQNNYFSTTSVLYWDSTVSRWSTTSSDYYLAQNQGKAFSTTSASYFLGQNQGAAFSTTSAAYFLAQNQSGAFSTTSSDYWKSQNNFFSTSSAVYWDSTLSRWATTSADYWKSQNNFFSTTSVAYWDSTVSRWATTSADFYAANFNALTVQGNGYLAPTTTRGLILSASSTIANLTSVNATSTNATTTSFAVTSIASALLKTNAQGSLVAAVAGTDYLTTAFAWATTSTDYWKTQNNFFSTTSASYFAAQGLAFATTSANYFESTIARWSTTSSSYFLAQNQGAAYSTTSADYWITTKNLSAFSTSSADFYAANFNALTVQGNGYLAPTTTRGILFTASSTFANLTSVNGTSTNATTTSLYIAGPVRGAGLTTCSGSSDKLIWNSTTGQFGCGADAGAGGGITAIGADYSTYQTGSSQTFATSSDTNILLSIVSSGNTHTFAPLWTGTLAPTRGGTGLSSISANGILIGGAGNTVTQVATSSLGLLTTNVSEGSNLYYTTDRVGTYLDTVSKGYFFSTTSAEYFKLVSNFFSTTSADYFESTKSRWATTSSDYYLAQNQGAAFSTTSAAYFLAQNQSGAFSTTSSDYWKSQNNFFSTTSAVYWDSTLSRWATTSSDYWKSQNNFFSTTSVAYWDSTVSRWATTSADFYAANFNALTVQGNGYLAPTTTRGLILSASSTIANLTVTNATTTNATTTRLVATNATTTSFAVTSIASALLKTNAQGSLVAAIAGTDYLTTAFAWATTSTDYWKTQNNFFSTTSASYFAAQGLAFATTSANYFESTIARWSTTSSAYFLAQNQGAAYSTTSQNYYASQFNALTVQGNGYLAPTTTRGLLFTASSTIANLTVTNATTTNATTTRLVATNATTTSFAVTSIASALLKTNAQGSLVAAVAGTDYLTTAFAWATTSSDYWKTQNNFFSTTSASFFASQGLAFSTTSANYFESTLARWATTSSDYWKNQSNFFSTTSANVYAANFNAFSVQGDGYLAPTTSRGILFTASSTFANLTSVNSTSTNATTTSLYIAGPIRGAGLTTCSGSSDKLIWNSTTGQFGCGADAGAGGGITAIGAEFSTFQTGSSQTFATSSDTNILLSIVSSGNTHTFAPLWTGTLAPSRGGTGLSSISANGILIGGAGNTVTQVATSSLGLLTTNVSEGSNLYYTTDRVQTYLDTVSKGYFFSTTSSDYYKLVSNFFSTTSADYFESTKSRWATTSSDYYLAQNQGAAFSTTSAAYFLAQNQSGAFSTTSSDYWKTQNNFFSTSSAVYWDSTLSRWATTSSDYWKTQNNFFSTTSVAYWDSTISRWATTSADYYAANFNAFSVQGNGYLAPTTTRGLILTASSTIANLTVTNGTTTNATTTRLVATNATTTTFAVTSIASALLKTNAQGSLVAAVAGTDYLTTAFAWATTSSDYWKSQNNFFSTTSASYFASQGLAFSTTSANYFESTLARWSTTTSNFYASQFNALSVQGDGYLAPTTTRGLILSASSTIANLTSVNATTTNATTTRLVATNATTTSFAVTSIASALLKTNAQGSLVAAVAGTDYLTTAFAWATTSSDYWKSQNNFFSTTSASYFAAQGLAFSTTSANYFESTIARWSTTSSAYFLAQNQGAAFSTTSAAYFLAQNQSGAFSTTSSDYWKSQNNFFSTTSAVYWDGTLSRWATTSSDYWKSQNNFFSTTSVAYWDSTVSRWATTSADFYAANFNAFSVQGNGYLAPTTTRGLILSASSTIANLTSVNATTTNATTTSFAVTSIASALLKTNAQGSLVAAVAGTDYLTTAFAWATTSSDYWKTQNNFFSTTSASYFAGQGLAFATTSADYYESTKNRWSTTSSNFYATNFNALTVQGNGYLAPTTTRGLIVNASSTIGNGTLGLTINGPATTTGTTTLATLGGSVGIGTTSPSGKLNVDNGIFRVTGTVSSFPTTGGSGAELYYDTPSAFSVLQSYDRTNSTYKAIVVAGSDVRLYSGTSPVERARIDSTGSFGIATTSPFAKLSVGGSAYIGGNLVATGTASTTNLSITSITGSTQCLQVNALGQVSGAGSACGAGSSSWATTSANYYASSFNAFSVQGNGYLAPTTTRGLIVNASSTIGNGTAGGGLTIDGGATTTGTAYFAENVGIGNNNPINPNGVGRTLVLLDDSGSEVYPTIYVRGQGSGGGAFFTQQNDTNDALSFGTYGSANALSTLLGVSRARNSFMYAESRALTIGTLAAYDLTLGTNNAAVVTISSGGKVGIGTTSPFAKLSVGGSAYIGGNLIATGTASTTNLSITSITGSTQCLQVNALGQVSGAGAACGSGSGGSGGSWSTTTSSVAGQLINYPNNATDIIAIGSNSTTSAEFWIDPNTSTVQINGVLGLKNSNNAIVIGNTNTNVTRGLYSIDMQVTPSDVSAYYYAKGDYSTVIGYGASALSATSTAIGTYSISSNNAPYSSVVGISNDIDNFGSYSSLFGYANYTNNVSDTVLVGSRNVAESSNRASVFGYGNYAGGAGSSGATVLGYSNSASAAASSTLVGYGNNAGAASTTILGAYITNNIANSLMLGPSDAAKLTILGASGSVGYVGIGTTSPYARLSVVGEVVARNFTATSTTATSTFAGGLNVGGGALTYDHSSGITSVTGLNISGALSFDTDAGIISWIDMPVTSASLNNTVESYTAGLNGEAMITVYGLSDGAGNVKNTAVGIGTTSPFAKLSVGGSAYIGGNLIATGTASTTNLSITSITGSTQCLQVNALGQVSGSGGACGGGGGSGGGSWSTTTSSVAGQLINYPNNATDIIAIGSNSTTTAEYWFDANAGKAQLAGSVRLVGGTSFPANPEEGTLYFRSDLGQLFTYASSTWQGDRSTATFIVAANDSKNKEKADFVADGTNDEVEINKAINSLPSTGGLVFLLDGTFNIGESVYTDIGIRMRSNVKLLGSGPSTTLKLQNSLDSDIVMIDFQGVSRTVLTSLTLDGNRTNQSSGTMSGITVHGGTATTSIDHLEVKNFRNKGVVAGEALLGAQTGTEYLSFTDSSVINNGSEGIKLSVGNPEYVTISRNFVSSNGGIGIWASATIGLVSDNHIRNNALSGIYLSSSSWEIIVTGNNIEENGDSGIYGVNGYNVAVTNNTIANNTGSGIIGGTWSTISNNIINGNTVHGIDLSSGNTGQGTVVGNKITGNGSHGLTAHYGYSIVGNYFEDNGGAGATSTIYLKTTFGWSGNVNISGNMITDSSGTGYGIEVESGFNDAYISGNALIGTAQAKQVFDAGNNTSFTQYDRITLNTYKTGEVAYSPLSINASSSASLLSISQLGTGAIATFSNPTSEVARLTNAGNFGLGTSSPYAKLSVVGEVVAANFTATSTTATSTFKGRVVFGEKYDGTSYAASSTLLTLHQSGTTKYETGVFIDYSPNSGGSNFSTSTAIKLEGLANVGKDMVGINNTAAAYYFGQRAVGMINNLNLWASDADGWGTVNKVKIDGGSTNEFFGLQNLIEQSTGGGNSNVYGLYNDLRTSSEAVVDSLYGSYTLGRTYSGGTKNFYGNYVTSGSDSTGGTQYGFYADLTPGTATKYPAILLGGNVGVGTTSPFATLSVAGSAYIGGNLVATGTASTTNLSITSITGSTQCLQVNALGQVSGTGSACGAGGGGSGGGSWSTTTSQVAGQLINYPNNATDIVAIGSNSTTTAEYWFDANAGTAYLSGNVGIGTAAPAAKLHVRDTVGTATLRLHGAGSSDGGVLDFYADTTNTGSIYSNTGGFGITNHTATNLNFGTNGSTRVTIAGATGYLGVGTTSPWAQLSINPDGIAGPAFAIGSTTATKFVVTNGGNVGIGTSNPSAALEVRGSGTFRHQSDSAYASWPFSGIHLNPTQYSAAEGVESHGLAALGGLGLSINSRPYSTSYDATKIALNNVGTITFSTGDASLDPTEKMRISLTGNVGIGTSSPYAKLSVVGEVVARNFTATSTIATSTFAGGFDVGNGALQYDFSSGVTSVNNLQVGSATFETNSGIITWMDMPVTSDASNNTVESYTAALNGEALLTIYGLSDGAGGIKNTAVGIGTTSPFAKLTVGGNTYLGGNLTATGTIAFSTLASCNTIDTDADGVLTCGTDEGGAGGSWATSSQDYYNASFRDWSLVAGTYLAPTTTKGIIVSASSTIGSGLQAGGLTINGGATTTGDAYFADGLYVGTSTSATTAFMVSTTTTGTAAVINNSGTGNILALQQGGVDKFVVGNNGGLTISAVTNDIVKTTTGTSKATDFSLAGSTLTNVTSMNDMIIVNDSTTTASTIVGNGMFSTSATTTPVTMGAGGHVILRDDGKYVVIHGGSNAVSVWDGYSSTMTPLADPITGQAVTLTANAGAGSISLRRNDGRYLVMHAGGLTSTTLLDAYGMMSSRVGPTTASACTTGTNAIQRPDGRYFVLCGGFAVTTVYDPFLNTFTAGPAPAAAFGAGAHLIQRDNGTYLVFRGAGTTDHYIYNPSLSTTQIGAFTNTSPITSDAPTISAGSFSIRRLDGKYIVMGGAINSSAIYDPSETASTTNIGAGTMTAQSGAGYGPTVALADGAQSVWRQDGTYLLFIGTGSGVTNIIDPSKLDGTQFIAGPSVPGADTLGTGAVAFMRPNGHYAVLDGGGTTVYDYDMGYVIGGTTEDAAPELAASYETECMAASGINPQSTLSWHAANEGTYLFQVKTGVGSCSGSYKTIAKSGDKILLDNVTDDRVQVKVFFKKSLPKFYDQEWGIRKAGQTRYRRNALDPALYDLIIDNGSLYKRNFIDFASNTTSTSSATSSVPITVNLQVKTEGVGLAFSNISNTEYNTTVNPTNLAYFNGGFATSTQLNWGVASSTIVMKRPDGQFVILAGATSTGYGSAQLYNPDAETITNLNSSTTAPIGVGSLAFKRPDGKFVIVLGNYTGNTTAGTGTTTTNIFDPVTNTFTYGPPLTGNAGAGAFVIPLPTGKYLIAHGSYTTGTTIYDPFQNSTIQGPVNSVAIGEGSLAIPRPDGSYFIAPGTSTNLCATATATYLFDPNQMLFRVNTNVTFTGAGTGPGTAMFQRADGLYVIFKGGSTNGTCVIHATANTAIYNAAANRLVPGPSIAATIPVTSLAMRPYGSFAMPMANGTWALAIGAASTTKYQIYVEDAGLNATEAVPDGGQPGVFLPATTGVGPTAVATSTMMPGRAVSTTYLGFGPGAIGFQRPDGKFFVIAGSASSTATSTVTSKFDAGWVASGLYKTEEINVTDLDSNSVLNWKATPSYAGVSAEVRTASSQAGLQAAAARPISAPGQKINPNPGDTWLQVTFNFKRDFPSSKGVYSDVWYNGATPVATQRDIANPTLTEISVTKDIDFLNLQSDGLTMLRISSSGNVYAADGATFNTSGADLAERYTSQVPLEKGEVVAIDPQNNHGVMKTTYQYQPDALGVVSTDPGFVAGAYTKNSYPIALIGRVPVKVTTENGVIRTGDKLTPSSVPGYAMKATIAGHVIGHALESFDPMATSTHACPETGLTTAGRMCGKVMMFVNLVDYMGESVDDALANYNSTRNVADTINDSATTSIDGAESTQATTTPGITVARGANVLSFLETLKTDRENTVAARSELFADRVSAISEVVAPSIFARMITSDAIEGLVINSKKVITDELSTGVIKSSSLKLILGENGIFSLIKPSSLVAGIGSMGTTTMDESTTTVSFDVNGNGFFAGILTAANGFLTNLNVTGTSTFSGALIVNSIGTASSTIDMLSDVTFFGRPYFTTDTAGNALVKSGSKEVEVVFDREYIEAPIVSAMIALDGATSTEALEAEIFGNDIRFIVTRKTVRGFTILLNKPAPSDIAFNWTSLAVKNAKLFTSKDPNAVVVPVVQTATTTPVMATTTVDVIPNPLPVIEITQPVIEATSTPTTTPISTPEGNQGGEGGGGSEGTPEVEQPPVVDSNPPVPEETTPEPVVDPVSDPIAVPEQPAADPQPEPEPAPAESPQESAPPTASTE